jgi:hypothetical protein
MLVTLAALLALAAPGEGRASEKPHEHAAACAVVEIRSDQSRHDRDRFSATRIVELHFETRLFGRPKRAQTLRLRLYTPGGFLYQVLAVPLDAKGRRSVDARLPVAGTSIMASGLYGRWRIVPHLDDSPDACGPGRRFAIRP